MAAEVWITSGKVAPGDPASCASETVRPTAEMIPSVTLLARPSGLPMASTMSPTCSLEESAKRAGHQVRRSGDLDHGQVIRRVAAGQPGRQRARRAGQEDLERGGGADHVRVGHDVAGRVVDHPGAKAGCGLDLHHRRQHPADRVDVVLLKRHTSGGRRSRRRSCRSWRRRCRGGSAARAPRAGGQHTASAAAAAPGPRAHRSCRAPGSRPCTCPDRRRIPDHLRSIRLSHSCPRETASASPSSGGRCSRARTDR